MRGFAQVGFNYKHYLQNLDLAKIEIPFRSDHPKYDEIRGRMQQNLN